MATNTIKTRIQLKNDTEAHWNLAVNFVPKEGEVIIYSADDTHPFSRLKVGDGNTTVINLPFIDSNSVNSFYLADGTSMFPGVGEENMNYIDVQSDTIYQWETNQYVAKYGFIKQSLRDMLAFDAGEMTNLIVNDASATLMVINGHVPSLTINDISIITGKGDLT